MQDPIPPYGWRRQSLMDKYPPAQAHDYVILGLLMLVAMGCTLPVSLDQLTGSFDERDEWVPAIVATSIWDLWVWGVPVIGIFWQRRLAKSVRILDHSHLVRAAWIGLGFSLSPAFLLLMFLLLVHVICEPILF